MNEHVDPVMQAVLAGWYSLTLEEREYWIRKAGEAEPWNVNQRDYFASEGDELPEERPNE